MENPPTRGGVLGGFLFDMFRFEEAGGREKRRKKRREGEKKERSHE